MWLKSEQSFVVSPYQSMILSVDVLQLIHSQTMAYDIYKYINTKYINTKARECAG